VQLAKYLVEVPLLVTAMAAPVNVEGIVVILDVAYVVEARSCCSALPSTVAAMAVPCHVTP
jgi:hypothetical protein